MRKNRQVNLEYMRFTGRRYAASVAPTDAEIAAYAAKNDAKLREAYEQKKFVYEKVPAAAPAASDPDQAAGRRQAGRREGGAGQGRGAGREAEEGRQGQRQGRADVHRARDPGLRGRRRPRGAAATSAGGPAAAPTSRRRRGQVCAPPSLARWSAPSRGTTASSSPRSRGRARVDLPFDKAKLELAEEKLREELANTKAKAEAEAAPAKAKQSPTVALKTIFPSSDTRVTTPPRRPTPVPTPRVEETGLFALRATPGGGRHRGDRHLERDGQGGLRAYARAAPSRDRSSSTARFIVIRLKDRKEPDMAELDKQQAGAGAARRSWRSGSAC